MEVFHPTLFIAILLYLSPSRTASLPLPSTLYWHWVDFHRKIVQFQKRRRGAGWELQYLMIKKLKLLQSWGGGVLEKLPSVGEVWRFSETAQFIVCTIKITCRLLVLGHHNLIKNMKQTAVIVISHNVYHRCLFHVFKNYMY